LTRRPHHCRTRKVQSYSQKIRKVAPMCTRSNTWFIPWTHPSPHPKWHLDRFIRFLHSLRQTVPTLYNGPPLYPQHWDLDCMWYMLHWVHCSPQPKRNLDRFNHLCRAHDSDRQTDRQTTLRL